MACLTGRAVHKQYPFDTGCLPLNYSGNPGVNGVSDSDMPACRNEQADSRLLALDELISQLTGELRHALQCCRRYVRPYINLLGNALK